MDTNPQRLPDQETDVALAVVNPNQRLPLNEMFGPTIQGEGPMIGCPCIFVRMHNCPVRCSGCDTHYTWDGSEQALKTSSKNAARRLHGLLAKHPGCGVVLSGGEPLLYQSHAGFRAIIESVLGLPRWVSIETSGISGTDEIDVSFLSALSSVTLSPKITPCLRGVIDPAKFYDAIRLMTTFLPPTKLCLKFVVRDMEDLKVVIKADKDYELARRGFQVYLMPYGIHSEEVRRACIAMVPMLSQTGYILSPRLHALLWGKQRGV